jgi:glyoxylase-like metal-dependent hydrolase (beta-lactamase superfamily II)
VSLFVHHSTLLHYNAGAFVSRGEACLVDPGVLPDDVKRLAASLGEVEIGTVVLTHSDWDHVLGPEHLPPARVVAHAAYERTLDLEGIRVVLGQLEESSGIARERPFDPPLPDETFDDGLTLRVGELELRLEHAPGHTADMLTIYEPGSAILWAADMLSDVELPLVCHDLADYERTLAGLSDRQIRTLVPGHGARTDEPPEIRRRIDEDRRYLDRLRSGVTDAVSAGRSLDETVLGCADSSLRRSDEDATIHRLNVEKVYADLGGDADPSEIGYVRVWMEATRA